jgi:uncharacterized membrane protein YeaQ/YmgE (transglycosylase-associated protein family)
MRKCIVLSLLLVVVVGVAQADTLRCPAKVTTMEMGKGQYSPLPGAVFVLENFSAVMTARGNTSPLCFNRTTDISHGQVFISSSSLTHLFAQKIEQSQSKIKDVKIEIKDNLAHVMGTMKKGVDIHFDIEGPVSTDGTVLILTAKKIKADGIPMKMLLGMVGEHLGNLLGAESVDGVKASGDTLVFVPALISHVQGKIAKLELTNSGMMLDFESAAKKQVATISAKPKIQGGK